MSRGQRIHVEGGTYYVVQRGGIDQPIFRRPEDYTLFATLLATRLRIASARAHAYCWTAKTIHLVLQIGEIPLGRIMQMLTSTYARVVRRRSGESGHFFSQRYRAALVDPCTYLPRLVRYVHHTPVLSGFASTPESAEHTSHNAYVNGLIAPDWLTTSVTRKILHSQLGDVDCELFMQCAPTPEDVALFGCVDSNQLRIIGDVEFLDRLPRYARNYRSKASLESIIHTVTCRLGIDQEAVFSGSRKRDLTLARALIAWYADKRGVAKLSQVARRLGRDPSTISVAIRRHSQKHPELFRLAAIHDIGPLVPLRTIATLCSVTATGPEEYEEETFQAL